jgi:hypothetical protein
MLLTILQNNLVNIPSPTYGGVLKRWNGSAWVIHKLRNYNGINVGGKPLKVENSEDSIWLIVQQAP